MIRVILFQAVQDGPDHWSPRYKTLDIEAADLEVLMSGPGDVWTLQGAEVLYAKKEP
jgi:hypothetical protein